MKTLILGLGNPLLTDDSVGLRVAQELENKLSQPEVTVLQSTASGLDLLDLVIGFDRLIIIDAIQTKKGKAGQIYRLEIPDLDFSRHVACPHDVNLATALELGKRLGLAVPREVVIFAIEVVEVATFSEECTPEVEQAIPLATEMVLGELGGHKDA